MRIQVIALFLVALYLASFVRVQTQGQITGVVTDSSGAVVAGASITVTNPQTNFTRQVQTNSTGNYVFPTLLPGLYSLRVEIQGFQTEVRNQIELQVAQVARIDFQLKVGAVTESLEVTGGALLLNTEDATTRSSRRITIASAANAACRCLTRVSASSPRSFTSCPSARAAGSSIAA